MPKPYSYDLRVRVIELIEAGSSRREAAELYAIRRLGSCGWSSARVAQQASPSECIRTCCGIRPATSWPTKGRIRGRSRTTSGIGTCNRRPGTRRSRRIDFGVSGRTSLPPPRCVKPECQHSGSRAAEQSDHARVVCLLRYSGRVQRTRDSEKGRPFLTPTGDSPR